MRSIKLRVGVVTLASAGAIGSFLVGAPAPGAKALNCTVKKEHVGCKLPTGASYAVGFPRGSINLIAGRGFIRVVISGPLVCSSGPPHVVNLHDTIRKAAKVGGSYHLDEKDLSGAVGVYDHTVGIVKFVSARKASVDLRYTYLKNGAAACVARVTSSKLRRV